MIGGYLCLCLKKRWWWRGREGARRAAVRGGVGNEKSACDQPVPASDTRPAATSLP
jgi:hypothetical protein